MVLPHFENYSKSCKTWKIGQTIGICCPGAETHRPEKPVTITAEIVADRADTMDIERRTWDGRPLKDKGRFILNSLLESSFVRGKNFGISATIFFKMPCRPVPKDKASLAELLALLSRIAGLPVRQDIPVTGIIDSEGNISASDDLACKIELFFDLCQTEAPPEFQGVMIPQAAVSDMVLRRDVVQAIENQFFYLIPIHTVEEGFQILSGVEDGKTRLFR